MFRLVSEATLLPSVGGEIAGLLAWVLGFALAISVPLLLFALWKEVRSLREEVRRSRVNLDPQSPSPANRH